MKSLLVAIAIPASVALGAQPSFDCAKATGAVEELVCKDTELATLDRKLSDLYDEALKQFRKNDYEDPRPLQRRWVKGRNECSKADDVRTCVETAYKHRIADLRIQYGQLRVPPTVSYDCGDFDLAAVLYQDTDPPTVVLTPTGQREGTDQIIAHQILSGSGARYRGHNVDFWEHHGEARLTWRGKEVTCKVRGR
jgi:uncharacterized protein